MAYPTPILWYKFEDNLEDSSDNGNNGTEVGTIIYGTSNTGLGKCYGPHTSDGNYISAPTNLGITGNSRWTWCMWLYTPNADEAVQKIFEYGTDAASYKRIMFDYNRGSELLSIHLYNHDDTFTPTISQATWYHIGLTYDQSIIRLYVNGTEVDTTNPPALAITQYRHWIGRSDYKSSNEMWKGKIDNYMVWANTTLTEEQIGEVMNETNVLPQTPISSSNVNMSNVVIGG